MLKTSVQNKALEDALSELKGQIEDHWGGVGEAADVLSSMGGKRGGDGRIDVFTFCKALHDEGYRRSCAEVCVLFRALKVACSELSTLSKGECRRITHIAI